MRRSVVIASLILAMAGVVLAQVKITGSVKTPMVLDQTGLMSMRPSTEKVRVGTPNGQYRATFEASGPSLWSVLEKAQIEKKVTDGFNRPIDLMVVLKGRRGHEALFSIGELEMGLSGGRTLLAHGLRPILPHKHEEIPPLAGGPDGWLDVKERDALEVPEGCVGCHTESQVPAVDVPRGICLIAAGDTWPPRFVEDVVEVSVRQMGIAVPAHMKKGATAGEKVTLVRLDGSSVVLHSTALGELGEATFSDATFGMGRGLHGGHLWTGVPRARIVAAHRPAGTDLDRRWVLATAADGYRTVLSGRELFASSASPLLATTEDDQPLGDRGPMRLVIPADFYVDRSVRSVQEIRLGTL